MACVLAVGAERRNLVQPLEVVVGVLEGDVGLVAADVGDRPMDQLEIVLGQHLASAHGGLAWK